jgi:hypothetical protein
MADALGVPPIPTLPEESIRIRSERLVDPDGVVENVIAVGWLPADGVDSIIPVILIVLKNVVPSLVVPPIILIGLLTVADGDAAVPPAARKDIDGLTPYEVAVIAVFRVPLSNCRVCKEFVIAVVVPIMTLPLESIRIRSVPPVASTVYDPSIVIGKYAD